MMYFVVLEKLEGDVKNAYSLVPKEVYENIPKCYILKTQEVEEKLYSKEELESLRDQLV